MINAISLIAALSVLSILLSTDNVVLIDIYYVSEHAAEITLNRIRNDIYLNYDENRLLNLETISENTKILGGDIRYIDKNIYYSLYIKNENEIRCVYYGFIDMDKSISANNNMCFDEMEWQAVGPPVISDDRTLLISSNKYGPFSLISIDIQNNSIDYMGVKGIKISYNEGDTIYLSLEGTNAGWIVSYDNGVENRVFNLNNKEWTMYDIVNGYVMVFINSNKALKIIKNNDEIDYNISELQFNSISYTSGTCDGEIYFGFTAFGDDIKTKIVLISDKNLRELNINYMKTYESDDDCVIYGSNRYGAADRIVFN
jgi:hypothetical protein